VGEGYFTRATLLPDARAAEWYRHAMQRGPLYCDHAAVWRLFPGDELPRDFLFRVGAERADGSRLYYVVSRRAPVAIPGHISIETKAYQPRFQSGETVVFSLRANPTVSRGKGGARSKRHDVLMDAKRGAARDHIPEAVSAAAIGWMVDRAPSIGLSLDSKHLQFDGYRQRTARRSGGSTLQFSSVDFDGTAVVVDPARLTPALFAGVGHSKGFGCGLLLVRRAG